MSRYGALKVLNYTMSNAEGATSCNSFVEIYGLRCLFPNFMKVSLSLAVCHCQSLYLFLTFVTCLCLLVLSVDLTICVGFLCCCLFGLFKFPTLEILTFLSVTLCIGF